MVKTPRTRHSKAAKQPVTIDLGPDDVSRVEAEQAEAEQAQEAAAAASDVSPAAEAEPSVSAPEEEIVAAQPDEPAVAPDADEPAAETSFGRAETPTAPQPSASQGGGVLAGGAAGALAALLIAGGLHLGGFLPTGGGAQQDHAPAIAALEARLAELREEVATLDAGGDDAALSGRVAEAEQGVATLASTLDALQAEVAALETPAGGEAQQVDLSPLEERVAAMESSLTALGEAAQPADLSAVETTVETLRGEIATARDGQAAASSRIDALEERVAGLVARVEDQAEAPATAVIIAASALKASIDRGGPFATELETFAAVAPDAPEIAELRGYAADGVATRAQLAAESDAAANAMIAAAAPVDPDAGVVDRLWASAMGLVQVRPVGMVEGDGVPEIAARLDAAVGQGDYERAIAEFETLPEAAKAAGAAFIARLRARHDADRLIDQALAAALRT